MSSTTKGRRTVRVAALACVGLLVAVVSACSSSSGGGDKSLPTVTVGVGGANGNDLPIFVGQDSGVFAKYGVNVKIKVLTPTASAAALTTGSVDIADDGPSSVASIIKTNTAKVIFSNGYAAFYLATKSDITTLDQLKGKTVATTTPGGAADTALRNYLTAHNLKPGTDIKIAYLNQNSAALAAVHVGTVQGAVLSPPTSVQAEEFKLHLLADISKSAQGSVWAVNNKYAAANAKTVANFVAGFAAATKLAISSKTDSLAALKKDVKITDQTQLTGTWSAYKSKWAAAPYPAKELQAILSALTPPSRVAPASITDNTYIDAIGTSKQVLPAFGY